MSQAVLLNILPRNINPAQVRCALTKVLVKQFSGNQNFTPDGWLFIGINGSQKDISEKDINTGSLYMCCSVFLALGLDADNDFWTSPSAEWTSLKAWNGSGVQRDQPIDF